MKKTMKSPFLDFNNRIFAETMRQLRTIGILALVILCLAAILMPVGIAIDAYAYLEPNESPRIILVSLLQMHPLLLAPIYTLALIFPLMTFGYLNKRNSSDFYHAIPVQRDALFVSQFVAIMTWIGIVIVGSAIVSVATTLCFPAVFQLNLSSIFPFVCSCLAGSLMVAGCVTVAMCITGTLFNNLLVAAILCFLPRILLAYSAMLLGDTVHILPETIQSPLLDISYNIPLAVPITYLFGEGTIPLLHSWSSIGYTAAIGCLWFVLAAILFRIRKSEAAERPASTPLLQHAYRLIITFAVTLIPAYAVMHYINGKTIPDATELFLILVFYLLAAIAFCVYELITTKKPKELLRVAKTFPIVLLADVVLIAGLQLAAYSVLQFRPSAEEIEALSFTERYYDTDSYFESRAAAVKIQDKTVNELVANRLENAAKENNPRGEFSAGSEYYSQSYESASEEYIVSFHTKNGRKQRLLRFTEQEADVIMNAMSNTADYQDIYRLPTLDHKTTVKIYELTDEQSEALYQTLRDEVAAMPFEQRIQFLNGNHYAQNSGLQVHMEVTTAIGAVEYDFYLNLSHDIVPKTMALYMEYEYQNSADERAKILKIANDFNTFASQDGKGDFGFSIHANSGSDDSQYVDLAANADETALALLKEIAQNTVDRIPQADDEILYHFSCYYSFAADYDEYNQATMYDFENLSAYIALNEQGENAFRQLADWWDIVNAK